MMILPTPADIERIAAERGISVADLCRRAGVAFSTFTRWRAGKTTLTMGVCQKLLDAAETPAAQDAA